MFSPDKITHHQFRNKLIRDYTLFELSDTKITNYYISNATFLIDNYVYFKDIEIVTDYLVGNELFSEKFNLDLFIDVINKDNKYKGDYDYLHTNSLTDIYINYKRVILYYFKRRNNKILYNKTLNNILTKNKIINNIEEDDEYNASETLTELSAIMILMNIKRVNLKIFYNGSYINIKLLRKMIEILEETEEYNTHQFNAELNRNIQFIYDEYVETAYKGGYIIIDNKQNIIDNKQTDKLIDLYEIYIYASDNKQISIEMTKFKIIDINLYTQYLIRMYVINKNRNENRDMLIDMSQMLLELSFKNVNNSFLIYSTFILINKLSYNIVRELKIDGELFIYRIHTYIDKYIRYKYLCICVDDQIYSYILKYYIQNKSNIVSEIGREINVADLEYEGFDRFVVGKIIEEIPVSSVFKTEYK